MGRALAKPIIGHSTCTRWVSQGLYPSYTTPAPRLNPRSGPRRPARFPARIWSLRRHARQFSSERRSSRRWFPSSGCPRRISTRAYRRPSLKAARIASMCAGSILCFEKGMRAVTPAQNTCVPATSPGCPARECVFEPVSAKTQPVSDLPTPEFRILNIHRAETGPENLGLPHEVPDIPRQRPGSWPPSSGNVGTSVNTRIPRGETAVAGWAQRIRTAMCRIRALSQNHLHRRPLRVDPDRTRSVRLENSDQDDLALSAQPSGTVTVPVAHSPSGILSVGLLAIAGFRFAVATEWRLP
jgi:hypothetical protein